MTEWPSTKPHICSDCGVSPELDGRDCDCVAMAEVEAERAAFERVPAGLTRPEYVELAIQCLDQADVDPDTQRRVRELVAA